MIGKRPRFKKKSEKPGKCQFCVMHTHPDYKLPDDLRRYLTEQSKIVARSKTGVCAKHQRLLAKQIKRARYLALLPFTTRAK